MRLIETGRQRQLCSTFQPPSHSPELPDATLIGHMAY
jgi:hypothetical protein